MIPQQWPDPPRTAIAAVRMRWAATLTRGAGPRLKYCVHYHGFRDCPADCQYYSVGFDDQYCSVNPVARPHKKRFQCFENLWNQTLSVPWRAVLVRARVTTQSWVTAPTLGVAASSDLWNRLCVDATRYLDWQRERQASRIQRCQSAAPVTVCGGDQVRKAAARSQPAAAARPSACCHCHWIFPGQPVVNAPRRSRTPQGLASAAAVSHHLRKFTKCCWRSENG
jgi:hypothetical protein